MTTDLAPHGMGPTAGVYKLCALFKRNPALHYRSITITENGCIEIAVDEGAGALKSWAHAIPQHRTSTALVSTSYGLDEADVLEGDDFRVTVRRPLGMAGGLS
jgi:hypothetical protein